MNIFANSIILKIRNQGKSIDRKYNYKKERK